MYKKVRQANNKFVGLIIKRYGTAYVLIELRAGISGKTPAGIRRVDNVSNFGHAWLLRAGFHAIFARAWAAVKP